MALSETGGKGGKDKGTAADAGTSNAAGTTKTKKSAGANKKTK